MDNVQAEYIRKLFLDYQMMNIQEVPMNVIFERGADSDTFYQLWTLAEIEINERGNFYLTSTGARSHNHFKENDKLSCPLDVIKSIAGNNSIVNIYDNRIVIMYSNNGCTAEIIQTDIHFAFDFHAQHTMDVSRVVYALNEVTTIVNRLTALVRTV